jgi:hypothetical protein
MKLWFGVPTNEVLTVGTYRFTFKNIADASAIPELILPIDFTVDGKHITVRELSKDAAAKTFTLVMDVVENPIPIALILGGIAVLLGLGLGYLILDKVEKLVDSPYIEIVIAIVAFAAVIFGIRYFKR